MKHFFLKAGNLSLALIKSLWAKYKDLLLPLGAVAVIYGIFFLTGVSCPFKFITGISCPGCGMTRALFSALKFDFASAFSFHPLWIGVLPALLIYIALDLKGWGRAAKIHMAVCVCIMLATYITRMVFLETDVVEFHPENNIFARIFEKINQTGG